MSVIYYSNFCEHSKQLIQFASKVDYGSAVHFICIDKRVKKNGKTFVVLQNGAEVLLPENITSVPALMFINNCNNVLYGRAIQQYLQGLAAPAISTATQNNMQPQYVQSGELSGFSGFGGGCVVSDQFSFLHSDVNVEGAGGLQQMHNYVRQSDQAMITNGGGIGSNSYENTKLKSSEGEDLMKSLQQKRQEELTMLGVAGIPRV